MFLGCYILSVLGAQLSFSLQLPQLYQLDLLETPQQCPDLENQPSGEGCFISDLDDVYNYKCWVTSHDSCNTKKYVGEGSICRHTRTHVAQNCSEGEWKSEGLRYVESKRVRRGCSWSWCTCWCGETVQNQYPTIACPLDISVHASRGRTQAYVTYSQPFASDDQGPPTVQRIAGPSSGSNFNEGSTLVRYRAADSHGATSECHFTVTVTVRYCSALSHFLHGSRQCTGSRSNVYGSSCSHTCDSGYRLVGNRVVECLLSSSMPYWTSSFPTCQIVSCGSPSTVAGGTVNCPSGLTYGQTCYVVCKAGYRHTGAKFITCTSSGTWTQLSPCSDVEAPKFPNGCPSSQTIFSGPLRTPAALTWTDPVTTDNSGGRVTLTSSPAKGSKLGPGTHSVSITATDTAGNRASCSFSIRVEARQCQSFAPPANGEVRCTSGNVEGSVCSVSCNQGYRLQGAARLTCLDTELWDEELATCQAIICPEPPSTDHGQFSCPNGRQNPAQCTLACDAGYQATGQRTIQCNPDGSWTTPGSCADIEPPVFDNGCKDSVEVYAAPVGRQTFVNLTAPSASDNSGDVIQVASDAGSGSAFPIGSTIVTYTATDASGNSNSCYTNVTVTALQCGAPDLQRKNATGFSPMQEDCPDGYLYGARCSLNCTQGHRLQGKDAITCARDDITHPPTMSWQWSGTDAVKPLCREDKCPPLAIPRNGALTCYVGNRGWECFMSCEATWDVPAHTEGRFVCSNDWRVWIPDSVPDCVVRTRPGRVRMLADLLYFTGSCNISPEQLRHNFIAHINQTILGGACSRTPTCVAENIEVKCGPVPSRSRRHADSDEAVLTRLDRARREAEGLTSHVILVSFHVAMPYEEHASPEDVYKNYQKEAKNLFSHLRSKAQSGFFNMEDFGLVTDESGLGDPVLTADCPPGTVFKVMQPQTRFSCVPK